MKLKNKHTGEVISFEPISINSALLSAQQRKRHYWSNWDMSSPVDKGIVLDDIIQSEEELGNDFIVKSDRTKITSKPVNNCDKPVRIGSIGTNAQAHRVYSTIGKSVSLSANGGGQGAKTGLYCINEKSDYYIRMLSPKECERLQNLNDEYTLHGIDETGKTIIVSNAQRYKTIGNGWTVDVIAHLFKGK